MSHFPNPKLALSSVFLAFAVNLVATGCSRSTNSTPPVPAGPTSTPSATPTSTPSTTPTVVPGDTTVPVINSFGFPVTSNSVTVAITSFSASDNVGVTGYLITENATKPSAGHSGWSVSAPTSFTFSGGGNKTAYAWAKDAAGNISNSRSAAITITLADATAPTVSTFSLLNPSTVLTVPVNALTASDNVAVTGYMITESSTAPAASDQGWSPSAPRTFTFTSAGAHTIFAWAKDAAGNISLSRAANTTVLSGTVKIAWDPPLTNGDGSAAVDIAGYKIQYGSEPGTYTETRDVGNATNFQIAGLASGSTLYFIMTTYNTSGLEGSASAEMSTAVP